MNILLSLADNLSMFWENTGFANTTLAHIVMIVIGIFFIFSFYSNVCKYEML